MQLMAKTCFCNFHKAWRLSNASLCGLPGACSRPDCLRQNLIIADEYTLDQDEEALRPSLRLEHNTRRSA